MISKILRVVFTIIVLAVVCYIFIKPEPIESMIKPKREQGAVLVADTVTIKRDSIAQDSLSQQTIGDTDNALIDTLTTKNTDN